MSALDDDLKFKNYEITEVQIPFEAKELHLTYFDPVVRKAVLGIAIMQLCTFLLLLMLVLE